MVEKEEASAAEGTAVKPKSSKKTKERKGKKARKKSKRISKSKFYEIKGDAFKRKSKSCPKCGQGVFLAEHKDRHTCGKCGYTEWPKK